MNGWIRSSTLVSTLVDTSYQHGRNVVVVFSNLDNFLHRMNERTHHLSFALDYFERWLNTGSLPCKHCAAAAAAAAVAESESVSISV